jgi:hypothetical protein
LFSIRPKSMTWTMFPWFSDTVSLASSMKRETNSASVDRWGRIRLRATSFWKPPMEVERARKTSAIPPTATFSRSWYLPYISPSWGALDEVPGCHAAGIVHTSSDPR